jgi:hypothetical protein
LHRAFEDISQTTLKLPNNTRFKGTYIMMGVAVANLSSLQQCTFSEPFKDLLQGSDKKQREAALGIKMALLSEDLWDTAAGIIEVVTPIQELLDFCNGEVCFPDKHGGCSSGGFMTVVFYDACADAMPRGTCISDAHVATTGC